MEPSSAERLINEAGRIFAKSGPSATVREICKAANCSVAAINYHFGDKHQLYLRCVQQALDSRQQFFPAENLAEGSTHRKTQLAGEQLRQFLRVVTSRIAGVNLSEDQTWHNSLILREILVPSAGVAEMLREPFRRDFCVLDETLAALLGELSKQPLKRRLAKQILAQCMFLHTGEALCALLAMESNAKSNVQQYADEMCESILLQISALRHQNQMPPLPWSSITMAPGKASMESDPT